MKKTRALVFAVLAVTLTACGVMRVGRDFDLRAFQSSVALDKSTQTQVRALLGAPASTGAVVETGGERYEQWTYYYGEARLPNGADPIFKMLQLKFDRQGILRGYNWSGETK